MFVVTAIKERLERLRRKEPKQPTA
jgi:hypothetical protein